MRRIGEDDARLDGGAIDHGSAVGLVRKAGGCDQLVIVLLGLGALLFAERGVLRIVEPLGGDGNRGIVGQNDRLVVEGDVVVRVLPAGGRGRDAAIEIRLSIIGQGADEALLHLGIIDEKLPLIVDKLHIIGVHEGEKRVERVARIHSHGSADAVDLLAGRLA